MDEITILPVLTAQDLVFIMFLPGELQAGDRLFNLSRRDQLLILSEPGSSLSFAVNLQAEASLRMAREVMLVEAAMVDVVHSCRGIALRRFIAGKDRPFGRIDADAAPGPVEKDKHTEERAQQDQYRAIALPPHGRPVGGAWRVDRARDPYPRGHAARLV